MRRAAFVFLCGTIIAAVLSSFGSRMFKLVRVHAAGIETGDAHLTIDYPEDGSIFPPDIASPTIIWHDSDAGHRIWEIEVAFGDGSKPIHIQSQGERPVIGAIDPRCVARTNELPTLSAEQAAAHTWVPTPSVWEQIKKHSIDQAATITIHGFDDEKLKQTGSMGQVKIATSKDPVGAPIFYRDVPLMPTEGKKGVISPIDPKFVGLITWRLKNIGQSGSRQLITGFHTCANCHSFSRDGKTMGADLDGPSNDKGLYSMFSVKPQTVIRNKDVIAWSTFKGKLGGRMRVAFMPQISPSGKYVVASINDPGVENHEHMGDIEGKYYVQNFKDYKFSQVFFPTRGRLAWYSHETGQLRALPGADDPRYVQTDAFWSPDEKYLVFARALAEDPFSEGRPKAEFANDPNETQIQYDLYRIPFNDGKGGLAEPLQGASRNGMSNSFPKVSPDGKWIVFVQAKNGLLMRPDSQLYIVPAEGGVARKMRCNTSLMNSWHSFSPNGRWMVFSSKSRSPYTQMFLTHIDENGQDSPAILIEDATASNRAVNLPEFVNIPQDGIMSITSPATEFYKLTDDALDLMKQKQYDAAVPVWKQALKLEPDDPQSLNNLGVSLVFLKRNDEAVEDFHKALKADPEFVDAYTNIGQIEMERGQFNDALANYRKADELKPAAPEVHRHLGQALQALGRFNEAITEFQETLTFLPEDTKIQLSLGQALFEAGKVNEAVSYLQRYLAADAASATAQFYLGQALADLGKVDEAMPHLQAALAANPTRGSYNDTYGMLLLQKGQYDEAIAYLRKAVAADPDSADAHDGLGTALLAMHKPEEALVELRKAVIANPNLGTAQADLGDVLYSFADNAAEAVDHWRKAVSIDADQESVLSQLAWVLATSPDASIRNGAEAVKDAQRAVQLTGGNDPKSVDTLAAALAESNRFAEAVEQGKRALSLAIQAQNRQLADAVSARVALYQQGLPYRENPRAVIPR